MLLVAKPVGRTGLWSVTDQSTGQRHGQYTAEAAVLRFGRGAVLAGERRAPRSSAARPQANCPR